MTNKTSSESTENSPENEYYFGGLKVKKIKIAEAIFAVAQSPMCCMGPISCGSGPFGPFACGPFVGPFGPFGPFGP
jgi:hypothetical protein